MARQDVLALYGLITRWLMDRRAIKRWCILDTSYSCINPILRTRMILRARWLISGRLNGITKSINIVKCRRKSICFEPRSVFIAFSSVVRWLGVVPKRRTSDKRCAHVCRLFVCSWCVTNSIIRHWFEHKITEILTGVAFNNCWINLNAKWSWTEWSKLSHYYILWNAREKILLGEHSSF